MYKEKNLAVEREENVVIEELEEKLEIEEDEEMAGESEDEAGDDIAKYLSKVDMLEKYKHTRNIFETPLSVFDLITMKVSDEKVALILNWNLSIEIQHTMKKEIEMKNNTIYIYPYMEGDARRDKCGLYEFGYENMEQIVSYISLEDKILKPVIHILDRYALAYNNCKVCIKNNGESHLEVKLLDDEEEVPVDSHIIDNNLLLKTRELLDVVKKY